MPFIVGFLLALSISAAARLLHSLSIGGALAATLLGTIVYGFGGWQAALVLIAFFVSSSIVGKLAQARAGAVRTGYEKGAERDAGQVLGNGIVAGVLAIAISLPAAGDWAWLAFAGSIAAVTADTWATELGALSPLAPRLITDLSRQVPAGTSGGVSLIGTIAAGLGAALIAALTSLVAPDGDTSWILPITAAGMAGALFDSFLGATVQTMYLCVAERTETEQHPVHRCGSPTTRVRGWSWLNNDRVNLACAILGALSAATLGAISGLS